MSPLNRRDALVLGGLLAAGGATLLGLRAARPVGEVLPLSDTVAAALAEPGPEAGNSAGDLLMLVFTDYNCPACRIAHPAMMEAVAEDGGVRLRFLDWPIFGDDSRAAARGALAAARQGLYLPVHQALMQGGRADGAAAEEAVARAGGSAEALRRTLEEEGPRIEGQLARYAFHAFALGVGGTPGHLAGRLMVRGAVSARQFRRAFARARGLG